jgi:hypothetical protein
MSPGSQPCGFPVGHRRRSPEARWSWWSTPEIKAISSECRTILAPHFRAAVGSLLRRARGQLCYHRKTVDKERPDIGRHFHEASRAPRSSDNGLPRGPPADVAGERLPDFRRDCVCMTSFPQRGRNMKTGQAIAWRSRGNSPNPPSIEGSIWSRRGNRWPCAFSVQSLSTRSTSRR